MEDIDVLVEEDFSIVNKFFSAVEVVPLPPTQNWNPLPDYSFTIDKRTKGIALDEILYEKTSGTACEPYKPQEIETATTGNLLNLTIISEPFIQFKIKAATSYISKSIGKWKIRSFPLTGHHFWLLVKIHYGQEIVIEAIHGLSTLYRRDANGNTQVGTPSQALKTWNSILQVYCVLPPKAEYYQSTKPFIHWIEPDQTYTQHYDKMSERYVLDLWQQVKDSIKDLNKPEVPYSFCGLGKSLGMMSRNSNSAYASIAYIMGVNAYRFKGVLAPGCNTTMLARRDLELLRN